MNVNNTLLLKVFFVLILYSFQCQPSFDCWDLNKNRIKDEFEDKNSDGFWNQEDCDFIPTEPPEQPEPPEPPEPTEPTEPLGQPEPTEPLGQPEPPGQPEPSGPPEPSEPSGPPETTESNCYKLIVYLKDGVSIDANDVKQITDNLNTYVDLLEVSTCFELETVIENFVFSSTESRTDFFTPLWNNNMKIFLLVDENNEVLFPNFDFHHIYLDEMDFSNIIMLKHELLHAIWIDAVAHISIEGNITNDTQLKFGDACNNLFYGSYFDLGSMVTNCQRKWINHAENGPLLIMSNPISCCSDSNSTCFEDHTYPIEFVNQCETATTNICCEFDLGLNSTTWNLLKKEAKIFMEQNNLNFTEDWVFNNLYYSNLESIFKAIIIIRCITQLDLNDINKLVYHPEIIKSIKYPPNLDKQYHVEYRKSLLYAVSYLNKKQNLQNKKKTNYETEANILFPTDKLKRDNFIKSREATSNKFIKLHKIQFFKSISIWDPKNK